MQGIVLSIIILSSTLLILIMNKILEIEYKKMSKKKRRGFAGRRRTDRKIFNSIL